MQKICYDRGGILKGLTPVALPPVNPRQALTRLEGHPTIASIAAFPGEVTVHWMTYHFIPLHIALIWRATGKGDLP